MTTASHRSISTPDPMVPAVLTVVTLGVAVLAAAVSMWLMPLAGATLAFVGGSGRTYGVPRGLAYRVTALGVLMLALSVPANVLT